MTRSEQKYDKAVKMLVKEYRKAQGNVWVCKPMAYSLYQVWKWFNANEKPRLPQESESNRYMELAKSYVDGLRAGLAESDGDKE